MVPHMEKDESGGSMTFHAGNRLLAALMAAALFVTGLATPSAQADELADLKAAEAHARDEYESAVAARDALKPGYDQARSQIAKGSLGFFESRGSTDAVRVLTDPSVTKYQDHIRLDDPDGPTSLSKVRSALEFVEECNRLRAGEGLDALKVSDTAMAVAEAQDSYYMYDKDWNENDMAGHKFQYTPMRENLDMISDDPFDAWYTQEKKNLETGEGDTGHYKNIVRDGYVATGFADGRGGEYDYYYRTQDFITNDTVTSMKDYSIEFPVGDVYSPVEYEADLDAYAAPLYGAVDDYNAAVDRVERARTAWDEAKAAVGSWSDARFTVSFDAAGGSTVEAQKVKRGSKATEPEEPTRAGYAFQGWYTARDGGSKYDFGRTVTGDITLYAHWSVNSYALTFDGNGGKANETSRSVQYGGQYGALPTATRTGHTFQGWYTARNGGAKVSPSTTMGAASTTVYAHWAVNTYTVAFDSNGGSAVASQSVKYGSKAAQPTDPTRAGYTFQGWYTARDGGSKYDFGQTVTGDVTLYARWVKEPTALRRLAGATRYDTMEKIVGAGGWKSGGTVIVASGGNYPDALAASGLAGTLDAPIVLTDGSALSVQASARLTGLAPSRIIVAGGRAAVSDGVVAALRGICPDVERVAGETRVDTSLDLYRKGSGWGSTAILATSGNFADALSVSSYAYAAKAPVFLVDPGTGLTQAQKTALKTFKQVLVVGGENAMPSRYVAGLPGVTRLSGATRYETSERIAEWTTGHGLGMDGVVYATGANFPDALAAGPLAGGAGAVTLLVEDAHSPAISFSAGYKGKVDRAYVVGGENAVSRDTADAIADSLGLKHAQ